MTEKTPAPSPDVIEKARRYLREGRVHPGFLVRGSETYRVTTDADPVARTATVLTCSCPYGRNHTGYAICSHGVAVLIAISEGHQLPPVPQPG